MAKDITEWRDGVGQLTREMVYQATVPISSDDGLAVGCNGNKAKPFGENLNCDFGDGKLAEKKVFVEFLRPSELRDYQPPQGIVLVGDNHITRGSVFVIGGAPGVGKSRAAVALAEAGATGQEWFGLPIHCKFRTLIVQNENGRYRESDNSRSVIRRMELPLRKI